MPGGLGADGFVSPNLFYLIALPSHSGMLAIAKAVGVILLCRNYKR
jgi:hypothetical protein